MKEFDPKYQFAGYYLDKVRTNVLGKLASTVVNKCEEFNLTEEEEVKDQYLLAKDLSTKANPPEQLEETDVDEFILSWDVDFQAILYPQTNPHSTTLIFQATTNWGNTRTRTAIFRRNSLPVNSIIKDSIQNYTQMKSDLNPEVN